MEVKGEVEEKRVKSTVIRRRAKVETAPPPEEPVLVAKSQVEKEAQGSLAPISPAEGSAPAIKKTSEPTSAGRPTIDVEESSAAKTRPVKRVVAKKKTKDELEMEMIERAGGLKKAVEIMEIAPERLERVFKPDRNSKKKKVIARREFRKTEITMPKAIKRVLRIEGTITVSELAHRMSTKATDIVKKLINLGVMATLNQVIDSDTALLVAHDFGYEVENIAFTEKSIFEKKEEVQDESKTKPRSPIVTVMGHVDHGKTTLLDAIRKTQVAAGEAGGITQHIGAYEVKLPKGSITFVDTPGHEAFTAMRARGAQVTDIVILVVAADDGVMPQTVEAIHHAKAAEVPIIVAINKMDKPGADPARIERGLMEHGLVSEKLGGDILIAPVSAKAGQGVQELLEMILLQAEVLELKADPEKKAVGTIIEARLDKGRGPSATVVIEEGTLCVGDVVVAGTALGKVRTLINDQGQSVTEAGPSQPVAVLGLSSVPEAGDKLHAMASEADARAVQEHRIQKSRENRHQGQGMRARLEDLHARTSDGSIPDLRLIIKGDVQGSVEAVRDALIKLSTDKVRVSVIHAGVGTITESDVMLAVASKAIIIGFNMRPDTRARQLSESEKIQIKTYSIIYGAIDDIRKAMEGLLKPTYLEKYLGRAEVRQLFTVSKIGTIAGCSVVDGKILSIAPVRVIRDGKTMSQGKISSLKRFKDDAREVTVGFECGIGIENFNDLKAGDLIEAFLIEEIAGKL